MRSMLFQAEVASHPISHITEEREGEDPSRHSPNAAGAGNGAVMATDMAALGKPKDLSPDLTYNCHRASARPYQTPSDVESLTGSASDLRIQHLSIHKLPGPTSVKGDSPGRKPVNSLRCSCQTQLFISRMRYSGLSIRKARKK